MKNVVFCHLCKASTEITKVVVVVVCTQRQLERRCGSQSEPGIVISQQWAIAFYHTTVPYSYKFCTLATEANVAPATSIAASGRAGGRLKGSRRERKPKEDSNAVVVVAAAQTQDNDYLKPPIVSDKRPRSVSI